MDVEPQPASKKAVFSKFKCKFSWAEVVVNLLDLRPYYTWTAFFISSSLHIVNAPLQG